MYTKIAAILGFIGLVCTEAVKFFSGHADQVNWGAIALGVTTLVAAIKSHAAAANTAPDAPASK